MPYRRLPNTDNVRIKSLKSAIEKEFTLHYSERIIAASTLENAKVFLPVFEKAHNEYKQALGTQVKANRNYQALIKNARIYISHFIQVFNLAVIRNELLVDNRTLYGLPVDSATVPDLLSEKAILKWGEKVIAGESERLSKGGVPIYNPAIAKVKVHYDLFKEAYYNQKVLKKNTSRTLDNLSHLRERADEIILEIWNQVEDYFQYFSMQEKLKNCIDYGIVYYYRRGEKKDEDN